jgi:hypothetical protein
MKTTLTNKRNIFLLTFEAIVIIEIILSIILFHK